MGRATPGPGRLPPGGPAPSLSSSSSAAAAGDATARVVGLLPAAATRLLSVGVAGFLLAACAPSRPSHSGLPAAEAPSAPPPPAPEAVAPAAAAGAPRFQLVYLIHGDADYIWHDSSGARRLADHEAVAQALDVAARSPAAEVLVFHQTPRRQRWSHPPKEGVFHHYRGGRLVRRIDYARGGSAGGLRAEAALFRRYASAPAAPGARLFFWFGHEVPLRAVRGFSRSRPGQGFAMADLAWMLSQLGGPAGAGSRPFSLIALSSCRGGTPAATAALFPFADFVLASPGELHLSHLDTRPLIPLLARPADFGRDALRAGAEGMARASFAALSARTGTAVTLSLYDSDLAAAWLASLPGAAADVTGASPSAAGPALPAAYADCAARPGFGRGGEEAGVLVLHRPPRFGRRKGEAAHSGWECPAPAAATARTPGP